MFGDIQSIDPAKFKSDALRDRPSRERGKRHSTQSSGQDTDFEGTEESFDEDPALDEVQTRHQLDIEV